MLDAYRKLQASGVIGPMMKVDAGGKPIHDPSGELPGQLVPRPFAEYPKAVRRIRRNAETGEETIVEFVANSRAEELKIVSDTVEMEAPRSPLERERDSLAQELSVQSQLNGKLAQQLESALARIEKLASDVDKLAKPAGAAGTAGGAGAAIKAEAKAVANKV